MLAYAPQMAPHRVLVVEDEEDIASPLVQTLEREGYTVDRAATGRQAVEQATAQDHDIVILDSSPLLSVSDSLPLLDAVDAVIFVVRLGKSTRKELQEIRELARRHPDAHVAGFVVNWVPRSRSSRYGYGYGY